MSTAPHSATTTSPADRERGRVVVVVAVGRLAELGRADRDADGGHHAFERQHAERVGRERVLGEAPEQREQAGRDDQPEPHLLDRFEQVVAQAGAVDAGDAVVGHEQRERPADHDGERARARRHADLPHLHRVEAAAG